MIGVDTDTSIAVRTAPFGQQVGDRTVGRATGGVSPTRREDQTVLTDKHRPRKGKRSSNSRLTASDTGCHEPASLDERDSVRLSAYMRDHAIWDGNDQSES